jgi:hypothetical protein
MGDGDGGQSIKVKVIGGVVSSRQWPHVRQGARVANCNQTIAQRVRRVPGPSICHRFGAGGRWEGWGLPEWGGGVPKGAFLMWLTSMEAAMRRFRLLGRWDPREPFNSDHIDAARCCTAWHGSVGAPASCARPASSKLLCPQGGALAVAGNARLHRWRRPCGGSLAVAGNARLHRQTRSRCQPLTSC